MKTYRDPLIALCLGLAFGTAEAQNSRGELSGRFYRAIRNNDLASLKTLSKSSDVNVKDDRGATPLMYAAAFGNLEELQLLLDSGAEVKAKSAFDATALTWAAGEPEKSRILMGYGADVKVQSKQGRTPLMMAARREGSANLISQMLTRGADPRAHDSVGVTALHLAAETGDAETIRLLIENGAEIDARDSLGGFTPLEDAAASNHVESVRRLLERGADVNVATSPPRARLEVGKVTTLMRAAVFGTPEMIETLLEAGAKVNEKDVQGRTPLMLAVASETQDPEVVRLLLHAGAEVNAASATGETALDWAVKFGSPSVIDALRKAGAKAGKPYSPPPPPLPTEDHADARASLRKSIHLLQSSSSEFFRKSGCVSCHHQIMTAVALRAARSAGIEVDESLASEELKVMQSQSIGRREAILQGQDLGSPDSILAVIQALEATGYEPDIITDSIIAGLASIQRSNGSWNGLLGGSRAPMQDGDISRTARAAHMLRIYGIPARQFEFEDRIKRARAWLSAAKPKTTDDLAMLLVGLRWTGADNAAVRGAAEALIAQQRNDGGWAGNPNLGSDAFATGEALYALRESGALTADNAVHRRGVEYLLRTQYPDGSWYVRSRAVKVQPYFESGFPFGHDQWISAAATAYASMAIAASINPALNRAGLKVEGQ